jgi:glycyl-tRNA synthetase beta chain
VIEFLLEIRTEEMPASHIIYALSQLREKIEQETSASEIESSNIEVYGTCRRLIVTGRFEARQKDKVERFIGPPKSVAFLEDGSPSPAALGFAKSQGVDVKTLSVIETEKGEYLGLEKVLQGLLTRDVLAEALPRVIGSLSFPKMMRWGENTIRFSRPIKNILCLMDRAILPFSFSGISSNNRTNGHKILFPETENIETFQQYKSLLKQKKVIIDPEARKKIILDTAEKKLRALESQLFQDDVLLEKLTYDVEHPYVFLGSFPEDYLSLPIEVLSTAMKKGQNLFSVVKGSKQVPFFVGVADTFKDSKSLIKNGNERVLRARLEDAKFFWEQDLETPLKAKSERLDDIAFQEKLGSYAEKTKRLSKLVSYLADKLELKLEKKDLATASELCKADLLTEMVREFPSLQGNMGGLYAREEGYSPVIWKGIYEHYQPQSLEDNSPLSLGGAVLSIADRMDSIVGALGTGVEVTGSKDPFGLRRNAQGVCKIVMDKKLNFPFYRLLDKTIAVYGDRLEKGKDELKAYCIEFFTSRLQHIYESSGYRYDLINAALAPGIDRLNFAYLRLKALDSLKDSPQFEPLILIAKRVNNILRDLPNYKVNQELLFEKEERELYTTFAIIRDNTLPLLAKGDFARAQKMVFRIRSSINTFFDRVLVMSEDKRARRNRLALLQEISRLFNHLADYSKVVIEG